MKGFLKVGAGRLQRLQGPGGRRMDEGVVYAMADDAQQARHGDRHRDRQFTGSRMDGIRQAMKHGGP
ncbi:hypothetical protein PI125_g20312 [Phytophthora idaei]|nr:hypothetical protein PI125_g20312 [Phytophthora idaei]